jgi:aryl-alcohol dehydrogenase-like predicted oxidoreductase
MRNRRLGNTDLSVSEIGFGCARIGGVFQQGSKQDQLRLLRASLDAGITFYDTADMYAQGDSERLLGEAFRQDRDRVVIASKVGYRVPTRMGLASRIKPLVKPLVSRLGLKRRQVPRPVLARVSAQEFSPEYIVAAIEGSLSRLRSDYLDLYQLHSPPPEVLERGDFVAALEQLKQQGKIRDWGIACERPDDVLVCLRYAGIASVQISCSLLHPEALDAAIPAASARGVGVIARQVFASGLLSRSKDELLDDQRKDQILRYADEARLRGQTLPAMALEFALAQPGVSVVLLGMHSPGHLRAGLDYLAAANPPRASPQLTERV